MWAMVITVALKALEWFLDRGKVSKETKELFFKFIEKAGNDLNSTRLAEHGRAQAEWLNSNEFKET